MLDPRKQKEALPAAERLVEIREASLGLPDGVAGLLVVAELVFDFPRGRLAEREAEHVADPFERLQRAAHEIEPVGSPALLRREVAEQALAMCDVFGVPELFEARARELGIRARFGHAP